MAESRAASVPPSFLSRGARTSTAPALKGKGRSTKGRSQMRASQVRLGRGRPTAIILPEATRVVKRLESAYGPP